MTPAYTLINELYPVVLLPHRVEFHEARPKWEAGRLTDMAERVKPDWLIYDVGAEEGDFTALYRTWVPDGAVVPVEPQPAYWPAIHATWAANEFRFPPPFSYTGFASNRNDARPPLGDGIPPLNTLDWPPYIDGPIVPDFGFRHLAQQTDGTPQIRLDALPGDPDAIVMDIEGAEWHALTGCAELLARGKVVVWVSVHEPTMLDWYDKTLDDIYTLMGQFSYQGTKLPHNGEGEDFYRFEYA